MILVSPEQRFTCAQCGRCCRRAAVPVTVREAEALRKAGAGRWFSEGPGREPGTAVDPFEPIPGYEGLLQIRKGTDGACGFLSPAGLCRLHEELGAARKPVACRVFPYRFHPIEGEVVVTASFACPTVVANDGAPLRSQIREINTIHADWRREQPEAFATVEFVNGHHWPRPLLTKLRALLGRALDVPGPDGAFDLRLNLHRIAEFLEDVSRPRVLRLPAEDLARYVDVMSSQLLNSEKTPAPRSASRLARLLFRGFMLAALSVQLHLDPIGRKRSALRLALLRLLAHLHGIGPGAAGFDLRRVRAVRLDVNDDAIREIATHYLRSSFGTIGTGRRAIVDEMAMIIAVLNAASVFARMDAARHGKPAVDSASFVQGLLEAADLTQADDGRRLSRLLTTLAGGVEAFYVFPPLTNDPKRYSAGG